MAEQAALANGKGAGVGSATLESPQRPRDGDPQDAVTKQVERLPPPLGNMQRPACLTSPTGLRQAMMIRHAVRHRTGGLAGTGGLAMPAKDERRRLYYYRPRAIAFAVLGATLAVGFLAIIPGAVETPHNTMNVAIGSVLVVVVLVAIVRLVRCVVLADDDGVTVRNPLRTYRIVWRDITGIGEGVFSYGAAGAVNTGWIPEISRASGRRVRVHALTSFRRRPTSYADNVINELLDYRAMRTHNDRPIEKPDLS